MQPAKAIPEKLFFKIGEVCELVGEEAHVLRYWESEFPMLAPQKSRSGQRTYRRKDIEILMRIKELLRDEGFSIAGAKKKLASEMRHSSKLKVVIPEPNETVAAKPAPEKAQMNLTPGAREAIRKVKAELEALLTMLNDSDIKKLRGK